MFSVELAPADAGLLAGARAYCTHMAAPYDPGPAPPRARTSGLLTASPRGIGTMADDRQDGRRLLAGVPRRLAARRQPAGDLRADPRARDRAGVGVRHGRPGPSEDRRQHGRRPAGHPVDQPGRHHLVVARGRGRGRDRGRAPAADRVRRPADLLSVLLAVASVWRRRARGAGVPSTARSAAPSASRWPWRSPSARRWSPRAPRSRLGRGRDRAGRGGRGRAEPGRLVGSHHRSSTTPSAPRVRWPGTAGGPGMRSPRPPRACGTTCAPAARARPPAGRRERAVARSSLQVRTLSLTVDRQYDRPGPPRCFCAATTSLTCSARSPRWPGCAWPARGSPSSLRPSSAAWPTSSRASTTALRRRRAGAGVDQPARPAGTAAPGGRARGRSSSPRRACSMIYLEADPETAQRVDRAAPVASRRAALRP